MIIRSQNKKEIVNLNMIDTIEERDNQIMYFSGGMEPVGLLGQYSTEEKAIKVLDMICGRYQAIWDVENKCISGDGINFDSVFYMPQDSEV